MFQLTKVWQKCSVGKSVAKMLSWQVWQKCPVNKSVAKMTIYNLCGKNVWQKCGKNDQLQTVWQKCTVKVRHK